ncbi:hypothetical protein VKT23_016845 [Stygiomarasmius scandens]|uniref:KOW domain-containing protein n=1 Tax=Marasmiellus scandens TaxID=2682957 RepID=A0ABR1ITJ6_9AGAR
MPSRNPFLDLEAYGSSEDDFEEQAPCADDEDRVGSEDEIEGKDIEDEEDEAGTLNARDGEYKDEDAPEPLFGPALFDSMEQRYNPEALAKLRTVCPTTLPTDDDLVDKSTLHLDLVNKAILLSEKKPLFWRIRCKAGQETALVFKIMNHVHPSAHTLASWCIEAFSRYRSGTLEDLEDALKEVLGVEAIPDQFKEQINDAIARRAEQSPESTHLPLQPEQTPQRPCQSESPSECRPERAFEYLVLYAHSEETTLPEAEKEVASILGLDHIPQLWSTALGIATLEPGTDVNDALEALHAMKSDLIPSPTSNFPLTSTSNDLRSGASRAKDTLISTAFTLNENTYHVFSAFSIPGVTGSVYLEAYLGQNPQSSRIVEFLRQQPSVIKVGNVKLNRQTNKHQQRVWLQPVSPQDIAYLLTMSHTSVKRYDWVKVTRGLYKDDVGLVIRRETSSGLRRLGLLLVPRLKRNPPLPSPPSPSPHPNHPLVRAENSSQHSPVKQSEPAHLPEKRKREEERRPQCLFNPKLWPEGDGTYEWKQCDPECYEMAADVFYYDLLFEYFPYGSVTDIDVQMDMNTRRLLKASRHPLMQKIHMPLLENWTFLPNEGVEVIYGAPLTDQEKKDRLLPQKTYRKNGRVDQVEWDQCLIHFDDYDDDHYNETMSRMDVEDTDVWISKMNLRKKIYIGDHVEVITGDLKGRHGFVVSNWGLEVDIVDLGSNHQEPFNVDINTCRITQARNDVTIPWVNRHVTVVRGQYLNHSGIVSDVIPPPPNGHTMLDVTLFCLSQTVRIRHDDVKDTYMDEPLCKAIPLLPHQAGFRQSSWDLAYAPTMTPATDAQGRHLQPQQYFAIQRQPPIPWIDKPVMVIKGLLKNRGVIKDVELFHRYKSGMRVLVEYDFVSAEHGANPRFWVDYGWVRILRKTGLPLHACYPLGQRDQRYWRPLKPIRAVTVPNPQRGPEIQQIGSTTPLHQTRDFVDPFHWVLDIRLDGKSFLAQWEPSDRSERAMKDVVVTPDCKINQVWVEKSDRRGPQRWKALPQEISLPADPQKLIKPQHNTKPLLVVRGEHTGKHLRQIYFKAQKGTQE